MLFEYSLVESSDNPTGVIGDDDVEVKYYYQRDERENFRIFKNQITDKEKIERLMVEAAIRHDSIKKKQYRRDGLRNYISGGPDNATCAAFAKENRQTKPDKDEDFEI